MIVLFHEDIFRDPESESDVSYLIQTIVRRGHTISLTTDVRADIGWLSQTDRQVIENYIAASLIGNKDIPDCEVIRDASKIDIAKKFSVTEAIDYVSTPLEIVLENGTNDSPLILAVIRSYFPTGSSTVTAYAKRRLTFGTAGGCVNVETYLRGKLSQYCNRPKFLHHYVILDGDRRYPDHQIKKYDNLTAFLRSVNVSYHIFEKRCMENYLPTDCFPNAIQNREWLNAYKSLSPRQRDFFNIPGGFCGDVPESKKSQINADNSNVRNLLPPDQQDFYSDVSEANFKTLSKGYYLPSFKSSFPSGYEDGRTNRTSLNAILHHQDNPDELKELAETIHKLL